MQGVGKKKKKSSTQQFLYSGANILRHSEMQGYKKKKFTHKAIQGIKKVSPTPFFFFILHLVVFCLRHSLNLEGCKPALHSPHFTSMSVLSWQQLFVCKPIVLVLITCFQQCERVFFFQLHLKNTFINRYLKDTSGSQDAVSRRGVDGESQASGNGEGSPVLFFHFRMKLAS